jgi:hypothetical protein
MRNYHVVPIDKFGKVMAASMLRAASDDDAVHVARRFLGKYDQVELWCSGECLARVTAADA